MRTKIFIHPGRRVALRRTLAASAALLFALAVVPAQAQEAPGRGRAPDPEQRVAQLKERLELNDQQVEQVRALMKEQDEQRRDAFEQNRENREEMREKMQEMRSHMNERMTDILNEEQLKKWHEMEQQMRRGPGRPRGPDAPGGSGGPPPPPRG